MPNIIYEERVRFFGLFLIMLLISGVILVISAFSENLELWLRVTLILVGWLILLLTYSFRALNIQLSEDILQFGFGVFKTKVSISNIRLIRVEKYRFRDFRGYGIRIGQINKERVIGYIPRAGKGLFIKAHGNNYFFISNEPEKLQQSIEKTKV